MPLPFLRGGWIGLLALIVAGMVGGMIRAADPPSSATKPRYTNRLAHESSPYLLQHAHNPVDWYPWGPEAFAAAKKDGKFIFLSIGYSSCHWCHVMERESFENEEVAKLLNDWFVCIKVDREERPDIDHVYMTALGVFKRNGGWPLSMFLTGQGKPIVGGTYWPPDDKEAGGETVKGFKSILRLMHELQTDKRKELEEQADKVAALTGEALIGAARGLALVDASRDLVTAAIEGLKEGYDADYGGFGSPLNKFRGPKFPVPPDLSLLQYEAKRTGSRELADIVEGTLDHMALGGIYDHVGGGFHRYSTERTWTVPHFEKMLYDNAQLAEVYAHAWTTSHKPLYRRVVQQTLAFVGRELTSPDGGFYSALDADAAGEEGRFYVWSDREIDAVLTDKMEAALLKEIYSAAGAPNFETKSHILLLARPLGEQARQRMLTEEQLETRLAGLRGKLLEAREQRPRPLRDTKILTSWNGQMIAGYAVAGQALEEPAYLKTAARAADFVWRHLRTQEGRLLRSYAALPGQAPQARLTGYLDDYAYLVHGLLCLHDATRDEKWLDRAKELTDTMIEFYGDKKYGGFYYTAADQEVLFARAKDQHDGAQPSGNSVAAGNLVRLWIKTGEERYRSLAEKTLKAFAGSLKENPTGLTTMAEALDMYLDAQEKQGRK